ncbi:MAG: LacI family DNA-binding transcriptional regulator [Phycisphaerae bacterium]|nr:LacI family DNA-binding transcriptional regulator [Phycisphaerae bacterium]
MKTATNLKDIAEVANVSVRTVARVLNKNGYVSTETRQKVTEAIQRLGYRPNRYARSLRKQQSFEIAVVSWTYDEIHMEKLRALETAIRKRDYSMTLLFDPMKSPADVNHVMEELHNRNPAAVAIINRPPLAEELWTVKLNEAGFAYLFIDSEYARDNSPKTDRQQGIFDAVEYLASTGRERIAYVGTVESSQKVGVARLRGYLQAVKQHHLPDIILPMDTHVSRWEAGQAVAEEFRKLTPRPDAVQMYSDELAMSFMHAIQKAGVRIPEDVAVMGFDDRRAARYASPPLSTVKQPNEELGKVIGELLLRKINGEDPPEEGWSPKIRPRLVIREST